MVSWLRERQIAPAATTSFKLCRHIKKIFCIRESSGYWINTTFILLLGVVFKDKLIAKGFGHRISKRLTPKALFDYTINFPSLTVACCTYSWAYTFPQNLAVSLNDAFTSSSATTHSLCSCKTAKLCRVADACCWPRINQGLRQKWPKLLPVMFRLCWTLSGTSCSG